MHVISILGVDERLNVQQFNCSVTKGTFTYNETNETIKKICSHQLIQFNILFQSTNFN